MDTTVAASMAGAITAAAITVVVVMAIAAETGLIAEASEGIVGSTASAVSMVVITDFMEEAASMVVMADFMEEEASMAAMADPMAAGFMVAVRVDSMAAVEATEAGITNCQES
jgi:hypothetical protein